MKETAKSILESEVLKEMALKELYLHHRFLSLSEKEKEVIAEVTEIMVHEFSGLQFLDGMEKINCIANIRFAKDTISEIEGIKKLQAENAVIYAIQSVLIRSIKLALSI